MIIVDVVVVPQRPASLATSCWCSWRAGHHIGFVADPRTGSPVVPIVLIVTSRGGVGASACTRHRGLRRFADAASTPARAPGPVRPRGRDGPPAQPRMPPESGSQPRRRSVIPVSQTTPGFIPARPFTLNAQPAQSTCPGERVTMTTLTSGQRGPPRHQAAGPRRRRRGQRHAPGVLRAALRRLRDDHRRQRHARRWPRSPRTIRT